MSLGRVRVVVAWASGQGLSCAKCTHQKMVRGASLALTLEEKINAVE